MNKDTLQIVKAMHFAAIKHVGQKRKGENQEPYFNHVSEVAWLLAENTDGPDIIWSSQDFSMIPLRTLTHRTMN